MRAVSRAVRGAHGLSVAGMLLLAAGCLRLRVRRYTCSSCDENSLVRVPSAPRERVQDVDQGFTHPVKLRNDWEIRLQRPVSDVSIDYKALVRDTSFGVPPVRYDSIRFISTS